MILDVEQPSNVSTIDYQRTAIGLIANFHSIRILTLILELPSVHTK